MYTNTVFAGKSYSCAAEGLTQYISLGSVPTSEKATPFKNTHLNLLAFQQYSNNQLCWHEHLQKANVKVAYVSFSASTI